MRSQIWLPSLVAVVLSAFIYHQVNRSPEISITSGPIGQNKTLKERMIFVVGLEKSFHKRGWLASIDLEGEDGKTLKVYWEQLNLSFVKQLFKNQDVIVDIREMGFKNLMISNGKVEWNVDLKN
jgi:hypothetical protein